MRFSEKLFKLRKENGLSQEGLAEKLGTTRQAISKWENDQGFPETEKLLMLSNIFEVSVDYLLKDTGSNVVENENGYYVSKEMGEGFLLNERKQSKNISAGISILILSTIPYLVFKGTPRVSIIPIILLAMIGIGIIVSTAFVEDEKYKVLKKETLIFDQSYLKELSSRYKDVRKKYITIAVIAVSLLVVGGLPFLLERKELINIEVLSPYYPFCVCFLSIGAYLLIRAITIIEAYELLVKNKEYVNGLGFKILKRLRNKINGL